MLNLLLWPLPGWRLGGAFPTRKFKEERFFDCSLQKQRRSSAARKRKLVLAELSLTGFDELRFSRVIYTGGYYLDDR